MASESKMLALARDLHSPDEDRGAKTVFIAAIDVL